MAATGEDEGQVSQPSAPQSTPWVQILVGAVIGGVAVWMIVLSQAGVAPSSMLSGVAATYQAARDAVLTPIAAALGVVLSPGYRDALALLAVLFAAIVRTSLRYAASWWIIAIAVVLASAGALWLAFVPHPWVPTSTDVAERWIQRALYITIGFTILAPLAGLIGRIMDPTAQGLDEMTAPPAMLTLWNAAAIAAFAAALFFINWATT
ncbi:MAG: hypothetical protein SGI91_04760 [Alphaproteobacteria bacterium]|jgi:hypothetical protein|nr:hypothetical protein [Alphaproteobacteria bacterium]